MISCSCSANPISKSLGNKGGAGEGLPFQQPCPQRTLPCAPVSAPCDSLTHFPITLSLRARLTPSRDDLKTLSLSSVTLLSVMLKPILAALPLGRARFECLIGTDPPSIHQSGLLDPLSMDKPANAHGPSDVPKFRARIQSHPSGSSLCSGFVLFISL